MTLAVLATAAVFGVSTVFASCGADDGPPPAAQSVPSGGAVEDKINVACGDRVIKQIAMATRKSGYGSRTDYWLVLCGWASDDDGNEVVRVAVGE